MEQVNILELTAEIEKEMHEEKVRNLKSKIRTHLQAIAASQKVIANENIKILEQQKALKEIKLEE